MMIYRKPMEWHKLLSRIMEWMKIQALLAMKKIHMEENYIVKSISKKLIKELKVLQISVHKNVKKQLKKKKI